MPNAVRNAAARVAVGIQRTRATQVIVLVYLHLWVLEGALRKWVPGTENIMYLARDGLVVAALVLIGLSLPTTARRSYRVPFWTFVWGFTLFALLQLLYTGLPASVLLAGLRNYVTPLLIPYLILCWGDGRLYDKMIRAILVYGPIQAVLVILQVLSPTSATINNRVGGTEATFTTADGIVRAAGSFSSSVGLSVYSTLALAAGLIALVQRRDLISNRLALPGIASAITVAVLGGARSALLSAAIVLAIAVLQLVLNGRIQRRMGPTFGLVAITGATYAVASLALPQVLAAFGQRIETADASEDTAMRLWNGTIGFFSAPLSWLGSGAGSQSAFGISLGSRLPWIEDDSVRWVVELGLLGLTLATLRLAAGIILTLMLVSGFRTIVFDRAVLIAVLAPLLFFGSITSLPTSQGYFAIVVGLFILAARTSAPIEADRSEAR